MDEIKGLGDELGDELIGEPVSEDPVKELAYVRIDARGQLINPNYPTDILRKIKFFRTILETGDETFDIPISPGIMRCILDHYLNETTHSYLLETLKEGKYEEKAVSKAFDFLLLDDPFPKIHIGKSRGVKTLKPCPGKSKNPEGRKKAYQDDRHESSQMGQ